MSVGLFDSVDRRWGTADALRTLRVAIATAKPKTRGADTKWLYCTHPSVDPRDCVSKLTISKFSFGQ